MPRRTADRPIGAGDDEVALQAAMRRALEQAAAPAVVRFSVPDPPAFGTQVAQTAPIRGALGVSRSRAARTVLLVKRPRRKEPPRAERVNDPRGRGGKVDVRG